MRVNGKEIKLDNEYTVGEYLEANGFQRSRVAVELNEEILSKSAYDTTMLCDTDRLEIVQFMGGG